MTNTELAPLPEAKLWGSLNVLTQKERLDPMPVTSIQPGLYRHRKLFTADQMREYAQAAIAAAQAVQPADIVAELEISDAVVERMSKILAQISITVNGPELPLHRHSYHDLAEKVAVLQLEVELFRHHAAQAVQADKYWCETCEGGGTINEQLGGYAFSNPKAECPDCDGKGYWIAAAPQPPANITLTLNPSGDHHG